MVITPSSDIFSVASTTSHHAAARSKQPFRTIRQPYFLKDSTLFNQSYTTQFPQSSTMLDPITQRVISTSVISALFCSDSSASAQELSTTSTSNSTSGHLQCGGAYAPSWTATLAEGVLASTMIESRRIHYCEVGPG
ncbi:hypothetical protein CVT26_004583 [Gymnopilus dilepis]|uniref:Uncharacterized protein n=1 Tax=Gymnopilus dilepis TaxID=231916 RepID=A0A409YU32_9AGAR|nr:hypothetical protein CVT26_004583 [Gymnopilus dilepis]